MRIFAISEQIQEVKKSSNGCDLVCVCVLEDDEGF
jgi:hypothetical protein